jgi:hypothetical protein
MIKFILKHPRLFWLRYWPLIVAPAVAVFLFAIPWVTPKPNPVTTWIGVADRSLSAVQFLVFMGLATVCFVKSLEAKNR